jgi:riboflavin synthase
MFTGLVEGQGKVTAIVPEGDAVRLDILVPAEIRSGLGIGDSVCINGCCLTVIELADETAAFQAGTDLERSLPVDGRLGGHFVQGHVDGTGEVISVDRDGEWVTMWFKVSTELARLMVPKGSVTVDGISLTVVNVEEDRFSVALIPHTLEVTTLGIRTEREIVNIETDILGKYVDKLLAGRS